MRGIALAVGAGIVVAAILAALRELRYRRQILAELKPEVDLGILSDDDFRSLLGWKRFQRGWLSGSRERRAFRRIARRLAHAKAAQRRAPEGQGRLLQVQVLTLRTRLRGIHSAPSGRAGEESETVV